MKIVMVTNIIRFCKKQLNENSKNFSIIDNFKHLDFLLHFNIKK